MLSQLSYAPVSFDLFSILNFIINVNNFFKFFWKSLQKSLQQPENSELERLKNFLDSMSYDDKCVLKKENG